MIKFACPQCKKVLQVKDELAGKRGTCPACKKIIVVPARAVVETAAQALSNVPHDVEALAAAALADKGPKDSDALATIDFNCYYCDAAIKAPSADAGRQMPCPKCRQIIKIPIVEKASAVTDWRQSQTRAGPSLVRKDAPKLEGQWGSRSTRGTVSQEALIEADVIKEVREPLTLQQWIKRGVAMAAVLGLLVWGIFLGLNYLNQRTEDRAIQLATTGPDLNSLSPSFASPLHRALGEYYRIIHRAEPSNTLGTAHLALARQAAGRLSDANERYTAFLDLLTVEMHMGLFGDERGYSEMKEALQLVQPGMIRYEIVRKMVRISIGQAAAVPENVRSGKWMEVTRHTTQLIKAGVKESPATDVPGKPAAGFPAKLPTAGIPFSPGLTGSAAALDGSERAACLAIFGQELYRAGEKEHAAKLRDEAVKMLPPAKPLPAPVLALTIMLGKQENRPNQEPELLPVARLQSEVINGDFGAARRTLDNELKDASLVRLAALLTLADAFIDQGRFSDAVPLLKEAAKMAAERFPRRSVWERQRIIELAVVADSSYADQLLADAKFLTGPAKSCAQLAVVRRQINQSSREQVDPSTVKNMDPHSLGFALAIQLVARHNGRLNPSGTLKWANHLDPQDVRPVAGAGIALGMRDREK